MTLKLKTSRIFLPCVLLLLSATACAQPTVTPTAAPAMAANSTPSRAGEETVRVDDGAPAPIGALTPQQLQEDLQVLRTTLEEAHPGLYTYVDEATRDAQFDALLERLDHAMSDIAFYRLVAPLVVDIHDAHTTVWPSPDSVVYTSDETAFLPFTLRFIERRAFVDATYAPDSGVAPRVELLSIDGLAMSDIIARLLPYMPHDGHSETLKWYLLGRAFPIYHGFVFDPSDTYSLSLRDPNTGAATTIEIPSLTPTEFLTFFGELTKSAEDLGLEIHENDSVAVMTIGWFGDPGIATFLDDSFEQLNALEIKDLIVDLRGNTGGGNQPGGLLYAYLTDEPFRYYDHLGIVLSAPLTYREHTDLSMSREKEILQRILVTETGERRYPHWYGFDKTLQPEPHPYDGNVFVLIDGGSGSSTAEFAAIAHYNRRAVFIGEETGGTYLSNNSGEMPTLTLPNSGIKVVIPLFQFVMAVSDAPFGRGVLPDYVVRPTVADYLAGIDTELEFALDLIQRARTAVHDDMGP